MNPDTEPFFALARHLRGQPPPEATRDDHAAARLVYRALHDGVCPRCRDPGARLVDARRVRCPRCRTRLSLTHGTPFEGLKLPWRVVLAATWTILVDHEGTSARAFARKERLRIATAFHLLHRVRAAIPHVTPCRRGATAKILGTRSARNTAYVDVSLDGRALRVVEAEHGVPDDAQRVPPALAWRIGQLRAWLVDVYRGVTARYLWRYLAEHVHRANALKA